MSKQRSPKQLAKFIRCQPGAFGNRTHRDRIDRIVSRNNESLFSVGHHDVPALSRDVVAELFENANSLVLVDARNSRHDSNRDKFASEACAFGFGFALCIFLGDFEPKLDGFTNIG